MATAEISKREAGIIGRIEQWREGRRRREHQERIAREYEEQLGRVGQALRFLVPQMRNMINAFKISHDFWMDTSVELRPESIEWSTGFKDLKKLEEIPGVTIGPIEVLSAEAVEDRQRSQKIKIPGYFQAFAVHVAIAYKST